MGLVSKGNNLSIGNDLLWGQSAAFLMLYSEVQTSMYLLRVESLKMVSFVTLGFGLPKHDAIVMNMKYTHPSVTLRCW